MIIVNFGRPDETLRRVTADANDEIRIGARTGCHVVIDDETVAELHARLVYQRPNWVLHALGPTTVNGHPVDAPTIIGKRDEVRIGDHVLWVVTNSEDPVEQGLIDRARTDDIARGIYADWLEEQGQWDRAEFLRLQLQLATLEPTDPRLAGVAKRLHNVARCVDGAWRRLVSRPAIEGCRVSPELTCRRDWGSLEPTDDPAVRSCDACLRHVHYVTTEEQAYFHAQRGDCIALDLATLRSRYGFRPAQPAGERDAFTIGMYSLPEEKKRHVNCGRCGRRNQARYRFCLGCGGEL